MTYETKDNTGKAFKNQHKSMHKHPDYTGDCKINGKMMRVAVYTTDPEGGTLTTKKGDRYFSFLFSEPREEKMVSAGEVTPVVEPPTPEQVQIYKELDDDIPF